MTAPLPLDESLKKALARGAVPHMPHGDQKVFRAKVSASLPASTDGTITFSARANAVKGFAPA